MTFINGKLANIALKTGTLLTLIFLFAFSAYAQASTANYTNTTNATSSLKRSANSLVDDIDMSTGAGQLLANSLDDTASAITPIGFDFYLMGVRYNQFSINDNGNMRLGSTAVGASQYNIPVATQAILNPFGNDMKTGTDGVVIAKVVGAAPNRVLVVQWTNNMIRFLSTAAAGTGTFQARMYETTGKIEYVYGAMTTNTATPSTYTVGFSTDSTANNVLSVDTTANTFSTAAAPLTNSYTASSTITQLNSAADGSRREYMFTPPAATAPSTLTFTGVGLTGMTLNWTDSANEVSYAIYRSTDGTNFTYAGSAAQNATTFAATGLANSQTYFWKVYSVSEGALSATAAVNSQLTFAGTTSGTKTVGPTGTYATLTAAFADITANGLAGPVTLELQPAYTSGTETFPLIPPTMAGPSSAITIRPQSGAAALVITSAVTNNPTVDMNNVANVIWDGRAGGVGASQLTIANTNTNGIAVRFISDGRNNTLQYLTLTGANINTNGAVVTFSSSAGTIGNSNNLIDNCDIKDAATTPANGVLSIGTTSAPNINNTISNSNIYNNFSASAVNTGILLGSGNNNWTISNNKFFQTATRTYTTANTHNGISITSGMGHLISGNTIGFGAANGTGTYTLAGTVANRFIGINFAGQYASIQGNTIGGFNLTSSSGAGTTNGIWCGINSTAGGLDIGTVTPNTIGGGTGTGSIVTTTSTTGGLTVGMNIVTSATANIANNIIGSITANGSTTSISASVTGIQMTSGTPNITGNLIGSNATALSINSPTVSTNATAQALIGINVVSLLPTTISGNTIANMSGAGTGTAGAARGISYSTNSIAVTSAPVLTSNIIHDIASATSNTTVAGGGTAVQGILVTGTSTGANVSLNTIFALSATNATAVQTNVTGIGYSNPTTGTIFRNKIYDLRNASTMAVATTPPTASGILVRAALGTGVTVTNNMISLGTAQTTNTEYIGIWNSFVTNTVTAHYNSIAIAGTATTGALPTFGFLRGDNTAASAITSVVDLKNNIFSNTRTGGTGKHYAIGNVNTVPATGWASGASNNNVLNSATASTVGIWGLATDETFTNWKAASASDGASLSGVTVTFLGAAAGDLHVNYGVTATPLESGGVAVATATDFDNQTRPGPAGSVNGGASAPDIGADEFDGVPQDVTGPIITYTALANTTATTDRVLAISVSDISGVPTAGIGLPVIYYKKNAGSYVGSQCVFTGGSAYNCPILTASLGGLAATDVVSYYVAAQDGVGNVSSAPGGASGFTANPPAASIPPASPSTYTISAAVAGTKTVCASGCDYSTLTGATGIFNAINTGVATGNIEIQITGDLTAEDGVNGLNQLAEEPSGSNFTVKMYPAGAARAISGTNSGALVRINGGDRVTFDGSIGGTGSDRSLTITNTNAGTSSAVVWLQNVGANGATNNTVKNINITGSGNTQTLIGLGSGSSTVSISSLGTGNNSNTFQNNNVSKTQYGIYSGGASAAAKNTGNAIRQNLMNTASPNNVGKGGILVGFEDGIQITQNNIGGINTTVDDFGISLGLTAWTATSLTGSDVTNATLSGNIIGSVICTGTNSAAGIIASPVTSGTNLFANNAVSGVTSNSTPGDLTAGMLIGGGTGSTTQIYFNSVSMTGDRGSGTTSPSYALAISGTTPVVDIRNNILFNSQFNSSTGKSYAIGLGYSSTPGSYANLTSNYNELFTSGTLSAFAITGSLTQGTGVDRTTLAAWQTETGKDTPNSISSNPLFNSATNLQPQTGSPVVGAGMFGTGILTDILGVTRATGVPPAGPTIGAYENAIDTAAPVIAYTAFGNTNLTANRTLSVTITDGTGVAAGGNLPRIYFKKTADASYVSTQCSLASGTAQNGTYNCVIDYSLVGGGSVTTGDSLQYFVVAQDTLGNLASNPGTGFTGTNVNTVTAPPTAPNSYTILGSVSGSLSVGTDQTVTSLTNAGGLFEKINNGIVTSNVTINLTTDLTAETGTVALNQTSESGAGNYTINIQSSGGARLISGSNTTALINLNGADRVTFSGLAFGPLGMTIRNTSATTGAVFQFTNDASNNNILSCTVEGNNTSATSAVVLLGAGTVTGNDSNSISDSVIRNRSDAAGTPVTLIASLNASTTAKNSNNFVLNNKLMNFSGNAFATSTTATSENWTVSQNEVTQAATSATAAFAFNTGGMAGTNVFDKNLVHSMIASGSNAALAYLVGNSAGLTISSNRIYDFQTTAGATGVIGGIEYDGASGATPNLTVVNNFVALAPTLATAQSIIGIHDFGFGGNVFTAYHNSVYIGGTASGASSSWAMKRGNGAPTTFTAKNNIAYNARAGGTGSHFAMGDDSANTGTFVCDSNFYVGLGSTPANFFDYGTSSTGTPVSFTSWKAGPPTRDANSTATLSTAATPASYFVDAANSNLHLISAAGPAIIAAGATGTGVTTDIDGETRPAIPDIGADQFVDTVAPDTAINSNPANPSNSSSATFTFSGTDARHAPVKPADGEPANTSADTSADSTVSGAVPEVVVSFECQIDGGGFTACTSPKNYSSLTDGPHTFQARAKDGGGNVDPSPASFTWVVDTIAPDTGILTNPSNPTSSASATFTFNGSDGAGTGIAGFECQLDGGGYSACVSGINYPALGEGSHTFQVRAIDNALNTDPTPAGYTWVIDATPPDTSITSNPVNPSNSASASFQFTSTEPGSSFQCQLDGGGFTACASAKNYSSLSEGSHTFQVRATDAANNTDASPASYTWVIDTTAPDTNITANPSNPTSSASASFSFTGSDVSGSGVASFECQLDGGGYSACVSPKNYSSLSEGSHTFQVRAIDNAGNTDASPASYTWVIDATPPDTTIATKPSNPSNSATANFTFTSDESPVTYQCQLDGGGYSACSATPTFPGLAEGSHTLNVHATDGAGNTDASPASYTWVVDTTPPDTTITGNPPLLTNDSNATFTFTGSDAGGSGVTAFECKLDSSVYFNCASGTVVSGSDGPHTFLVRAKDAAGNVDASPASYTWTVDITSPDTFITQEPLLYTNSASATFKFTGQDQGGGPVAGFECKLDAAVYAVCTSPLTYNSLAQGSHTFTVRSKDAAGNYDPAPESRTWTVDTTPPVVTYTPLANTASTASRTLTVTVTDNLTPVTTAVNYSLNGGSTQQVICSANGPNTYDCVIPGEAGGSAVSYTVIAQDFAGNYAVNPATDLYTVGAATIPAGTYDYASLSPGATLGGNVTVNNTLDLGGIVSTGANTLSLGCATTVTGAGANSYVVGNVDKTFCGGGTFVYPVGTTPNGAARGNDSSDAGNEDGELRPEGAAPGEYSPATVSVNSGTFPTSLKIVANDTWLPGLGQTSSISRYWDVTKTNANALNVNMTFQYLNEDIYGSEAGYNVFRRTGGFTTQYLSGTVNAAANTFTANNVSSFSQWGAGTSVVTAASADITGRVLTADGRPIANARVVLSGGGLPESISVYTGQLGYYNFTGLPVGQNYVVTVKSRRFHFKNPSHIFTLNDDITGDDFVAEPQP